MQTVKRSNIIIKRGILGVSSGTASNIVVSKNNVVRIAKETK